MNAQELTRMLAEPNVMTSANKARKDLSLLLSQFRDSKAIRGVQAGIYKYPARFSPRFVRAAIEHFTEPGDVIMDPFMGGGTTIVEALAAGRRVIGLDVNPLAYLVTKAKTTPLSAADVNAIRRWAGRLRVDHRRRLPKDGRVQGLPTHLAPYFVPARDTAEEVQSPRARRAIRAILLRLGQWALETRESSELDAIHWLKHASLFSENLLTSLEDLVRSAEQHGIRGQDLGRRAHLLMQPADEIQPRSWPSGWRRGQMVLTSPPYPGVHVLYHRWQVDSRSETAAPFWLTNMEDGAGPSHYTLGGRHSAGLTLYFERLERILRRLSDWMEPGAAAVQVLSFSKPASQLRRYRIAMKRAGLAPAPGFSRALYRQVPGRRWYAQRQVGSGGHEYLLVHRRP